MKKAIRILLVACITVTKIGYDEQAKWIYFLIKDDDLSKKCKTICNKFIADIKKEFDSKPVYNKNCLKTKIKSRGDEVTDLYDKILDYNYTCLAVIILDTALKKDDSYYLQVFLKGCKYTEKKVLRHVHDSLSDFSYSSDEPDEE